MSSRCIENTGEHGMDAGALLEYFAPLDSWLSEQNKGEAWERRRIT